MYAEPSGAERLHELRDPGAVRVGIAPLVYSPPPRNCLMLARLVVMCCMSLVGLVAVMSYTPRRPPQSASAPGGVPERACMPSSDPEADLAASQSD